MPSFRIVLDPKCAVADLVASSKNEVIGRLVDVLADNGKVVDRDGLLAAVLAREALAPTGLGDDCAVPHAQTDAMDQTAVAVARLSTPIGFDAADGTPARLVFLIAGPKDAPGIHLRLLSRLVRLLSDSDFRSELLSAPDGVTIANIMLATDPPPSACA